MKKQLLKLITILSFSAAFSQVGVNTTDPQAQLDIRSTDQAAPSNTDGILIPKIDAFPAINPTANQNGMMVFLTTAVAGKLPGFYYWDNSSSLWIGLAKVTSGWALAGNTGTVPGTDFLGTTDAKDFVFKTNNTERARFTSAGFLGIGTTMPNQQLELTGNFRLPASTATTGIIYAGTNRFAHNLGGTYFGTNAGNLATTSSWNTGIGQNVMQSQTTGNFNVGVGATALASSTGGFSNSAVGYQAINGLTTGGDNTAMGSSVMRGLTSGSRNVAIGSQAMVSSATNSSDNVAVGYGALAGNGVSFFNTAIGSAALNATSTGFNNTAVGRSSMQSNTTGSRNTTLGYSSLFSGTNTTNNLAIGYEAGRDATGSGNIFLGYQAGYSEAGSNKLYIDNSNTATPLVYGDFNTNLFRVNGTLNINNVYSLPTNDGAAGGVLTTNGAGVVAWSTPAAESDPTAWLKGGNAGTIAGTNFLGTTDFNDFVFKTNNVERARFLKTGFMGIGVNTPLAYLDIYGNNGNTNSLLLRSGNNNNDFGSSQIAFSWNGTDYTRHSIRTRHNAFGTSGNAIEFVLWDPGTDGLSDMGTKKVMTIDGGGNGSVGIGTVSPQRELHVVGEILASSLSGTGYRVVQADDWGVMKPLAAGTASQVLLGTGVWGSVPGITNDWSVNGNSGTTPGTNYIGTSDNRDLVIKTNNTEAARISSAGNVGIGTNAPASKLHIKGGQIIESGTLYMNSPDNVEKILLTDWGDNGSKINTSWNFSVDYMAGSNGWDTDGNHRFFTSVIGAGFTERMRIHSNGNVGIGTIAPIQAKLVINGIQDNTLAYGYLHSDGTTGTNSDTGGYSVYASGKIAATEFNAFSDERIKNIKGISESKKDLETLNKIQITNYTFKDSIAKGNGMTKKVIAQQIKKVYPQAVSVITDVVPDIYAVAKIKDGRVILKNTLQKGDRVKLVFENRTEIIDVLQADEYGFTVNLKDEGKVFVYGREVKDFHTVDYEALSTLNISATQELIKIINQQEAQIRDLKADNSNMNKRLSQTEADVEQMKQILRMDTADNSGKRPE